MARIVYYISGHGYGHATRAALVLEALKAKVHNLRAAVRSSAPRRLFPAWVEVSRGAHEPVPVQADPWNVDWEGTLGAHRAALARRAEAVRAEVEFLRAFDAGLILTDVPSLACEAAAQASRPCWIISNFTWDWVYAERARTDARWEPVVSRLAQAYARASGAFRLPMSGGFKTVGRVRDLGLLTRRSRRSRLEARSALGVPSDGRPLVLVSFGGVDAARPRAAGDLSAWRFMGFGPAPKGLRALWTPLKPSWAIPHAEAIAACDALIGKPGYGTFSEAAVHGARVLYVDRPGYAEASALTRWLKSNVCALELPRADYERGNWGPFLHALFKKPPRAPVPASGAEEIARLLVKRLIRN